MFAQKFEAKIAPKLIQHVIAIGLIKNLAQNFEATPFLVGSFFFLILHK